MKNIRSPILETHKGCHSACLTATLLEKYNALAIAIEDIIRTPDALRDARPQLADPHAEIVREMLRVGPWRPDLCKYFEEATAFETVAGIQREYVKSQK